MQNRENQFKELNKSLEKMQRESEKSFPNKYKQRKKTLNELFQFYVSILFLGVSLFLIIQVFTKLSIQNMLYNYGFIVVFLLLGTFILFFVKRKFYGLLICFLGIISLTLKILLSNNINYKTIEIHKLIYLGIIFIIGLILFIRIILKTKTK